MMQCTCGLAPGALLVTPDNKTVVDTPAATIMDNVPVKNIPPFGMCTTQANPAVAAATSAALGVPTPAPCMPVIPAPWTPGAATVLISSQPALTDACKCLCAYGGQISFTSAGQTLAELP